MGRYIEPFTTPRRRDSNTYQITLNPPCGLPERICNEWKRRSFPDLPVELAEHRNPKNQPEAKAAVFSLKEKRKREGGLTRFKIKILLKAIKSHGTRYLRMRY